MWLVLVRCRGALRLRIDCRLVVANPHRVVVALLRTSVIALGLPAVLMSMVAAGTNVMGTDGVGI